MFTKLISVVCVLTLALASASYGVAYQGDLVPPDNAYVLGNWEMCGPAHWNTGGFDGWIINGEGTMIGHSYAEDPVVTATLDCCSLKMVTPADWQKSIELKLHDPQRYGLGDSNLTPVEAFFANDTFEMDVTVLSADWDRWDGTYAGIRVVINTEGTGGWDPGDFGGDVYLDPTQFRDQQRLVWNYSHLLDGDPNNGEIQDNWSYLEICLVAKSDHTGGQTYYIDRAVLTPEPATIALLGLGGLSLLRVRRKR